MGVNKNTLKKCTRKDFSNSAKVYLDILKRSGNSC